MGSWWIYAQDEGPASLAKSSSDEQQEVPKPGELRRVPNGREDVFADESIDLRAKRSLMKFLKFVGDYERLHDVWEAWAEKPFPDFLSSQFGLPLKLHPPLLALTLSPNAPSNTLTSFALARIKRHLSSIGVFGPGFASVIAKWGGGAEIAQVACRACAVGGGVYVLGRAVEAINPSNSLAQNEGGKHFNVLLQGGETVGADWVVGSHHDLPTSHPTETSDVAARSITIFSSPLTSLFPVTAEGAPSPGAAVVVFPTGSLTSGIKNGEEVPPVYVIAHSSDTGECPDAQCKRLSRAVSYSSLI